MADLAGPGEVVIAHERSHALCWSWSLARLDTRWLALICSARDAQSAEHEDETDCPQGARSHGAQSEAMRVPPEGIAMLSRTELEPISMAAKMGMD